MARADLQGETADPGSASEARARISFMRRLVALLFVVAVILFVALGALVLFAAWRYG